MIQGQPSTQITPITMPAPDDLSLDTAVLEAQDNYKSTALSGLYFSLDEFERNRPN